MNYNYEDLINNLHDAVYFVDCNRQITLWNKSAERLTGYTAKEVIGSRCSENILTHVDENGMNLCLGQCPLLLAIKDGASLEKEVFLNHKKGHRVPVMIRVTPLRDLEGNIVGAAEMFTDITPAHVMREKMDQLTKLAMLDPLTMLSNRVHMMSELEMIFHEWDRYGANFGFLFMDVDNLKEINDLHGHDVGDQILKTVALTLSGTGRPFDLFGRWGGDEFVGIIRNVERSELRKVGERCRALVEKSYTYVDDSFLRATISVGATVPTSGDTIDSVVKRADSLMYKSKNNGGNCVSD